MSTDSGRGPGIGSARTANRDPSPGQVRRARPSDAPEIVAALQRATGMTYFGEWMYDVDAVAAALSIERIVSWIVVAPDGTVAAHGALEFAAMPGSGTALTTSAAASDGSAPAEDAKFRGHIVEYGTVFTAPAYRGHGLTDRVGTAALAWAQRHGIDEIWLWTTTLRPYAQLAARHAGAQEMCLLLAMMPPGVNRGHDNDVPEAVAAMVFVLRLRAAREHGTWFIPPAHHDLVASLVAGSAVHLMWPPDLASRPSDRTAVNVPQRLTATETPPGASTDDAASEVVATYVRGLRFVVISVVEASERTVGDVVRSAFAFAARGASVAYVDLDPTRADHMGLVGEFERFGFTFAGIHPDYPRGRLRFRLQALTGALQDRATIAVASPRGQTLLDHVWARLPAPR